MEIEWKLLVGRIGAAVAILLTAAPQCTAVDLRLDVAAEHLSATFAEQRTFEASSVTLGLELLTRKDLSLRLEVPAVRARSSQPLYVVLGPTPRVLNALARGNRNLQRQVPGDWESGVGDVRLRVLQELGGGGARLFRTAVELDVKAPTGNEREGLGTGAWDARLGFLGERRFWSATLFGGAGYNRLGDPKNAELRDVPDGLFGVESEPWHGVHGALWLEGHGAVQAGTGSRSALGIGVRGAGSRSWRAAATLGLTGAEKEVGFALGVSLASPGSAAGAWGRLPGREREE